MERNKERVREREREKRWWGIRRLGKRGEIAVHVLAAVPLIETGTILFLSEQNQGGGGAVGLINGGFWDRIMGGFN